MINEVHYTPYSDILLYTAKTLKENFPKCNIYVDQNENEIAVPSFFIKVVPLTQVNYFDWRKKLVNINISYVNKEGYQQDKLDIIDSITEAFEDRIVVGEKKPNKRALPIIEQSFEESDALIFTITLNYFDGKGKISDTNREYDALLEIIGLNIEIDTNDKRETFVVESTIQQNKR